MSILSGEKIEKRYGKVQALKGLDIHLDEGETYGFLGKNGAGKSTTLQVIMGITLADAGKVCLFGKELKGDDPSLRSQIGYVAQEQNFYPWMTPKRIGKFVSGFYPNWDDSEYRRLLNLLEVPFERKILGFSGGMRAKLALSLALSHHPRLLLLDEPTAGMDPVARREFIDIVKTQAQRSQRTTLFSSHLIDEVERAADRVGIVDDGRMCYEGSLEDLRKSAQRYVLRSEPDETLPPVLLDYISACNGKLLSDEVRKDVREVIVRFDQSDENTIIAPPEFESLIRQEQPSLEDIFIAMVTRKVAL